MKISNTKLEKLVQKWQDKTILILGFGEEGRDVFQFLRQLFPNKIIGIADQKEKNALEKSSQKLLQKQKNYRLHLGSNHLQALRDYDVIIKSPGVPIHLPEVEKAYQEKKITSQSEIFFNFYQGTIAGVTATKGKSTTTTLIYKILKNAGLKVHLVGNIGAKKPVLPLLFKSHQNDIYAYELSSHQLYNLKKSPEIAVLLNIYPEHLDYYKNFEEYKNAKANIARHQTKNDILIYNYRDPNVKTIAQKSKARKLKIPFSSPLISRIKKLIANKNARFINLIDIMAAVRVAKIFHVEDKIVLNTISNFKLLKHRLEYVGTYKGISFYNDSLSTIPETTVFALDTLGPKVKTLIAGGFDRGLDFSKLAKNILKRNLRTLILLPETGKKIKEAIEKITKSDEPEMIFAENLEQAVLLSYIKTKKGEICLLSPAAPSFGMFRNYKDRGNTFKKYVKKYGNENFDKITKTVENKLKLY